MQSGGYGNVTSTVFNTATSNANIDGLLADERWSPNTITFSFTNNFRNDYEDELGYSNSATHAGSFRGFNSLQKQRMRKVIRELEGFTQLNLRELSGSQDRDATIRIAQSNDPSYAYAYLPGDSYNYFEAGDLWFNRTDFLRPNVGTDAYLTFLHELGHGLGLKHGHEAGGAGSTALPRQRDSNEFSVMTYRSYPNQSLTNPGFGPEIGGSAQSFMMLDIAALQKMYGANYQTQSGNTTYSFSPQTGALFINGVSQGNPIRNRIFRTIWDGNGNDTYDLSNYSRSVSINLNPGRWSDFDLKGTEQQSIIGGGSFDPIYARGHLFNALMHRRDRRSLIENAIGGSGDDRLVGNIANNLLDGSSGNDSIFGKVGDDRLLGRNGEDILSGGADNDLLRGGDGDDQLFGADETSRGRDEVDQLSGGRGQDIFHLGEGAVTFYRDAVNNGDNSYAHILDLDVIGSEADRINVLGSINRYGVRAKSIDGNRGVGVFLDSSQGSDLIAFVEGDGVTVNRVIASLF